MSSFVEIKQVDKEFPLESGGTNIVLKGIDLEIKQGTFVTLIGHSGSGKSTLLNMVSGLDKPSRGSVVVAGNPVIKPGPDRMVVFQNYSLLPWLTVWENVALAVNKTMSDKPLATRNQIIEHHLEMVKLKDAAQKKPKQLSGGMRQRVAIARALATQPKLLLLDEPFGALDALTRGDLQKELMRICNENSITCLMVTHDVDEALLLSDRVVMLTTGPGAHIGQILQVPFPRPRYKTEVENHPKYYSLREEMLYFLDQQKTPEQQQKSRSYGVSRQGLEKAQLELGFIPVTDCAPLLIAETKGFFAKYGFEQVSLIREASWRNLAGAVLGGNLDAAQMLAGMPLWLTLGGMSSTYSEITNDPATPVISALTLSRNGDAITLSRRLHEQGVRTLEDFKAVVLATPKTETMGIVHPASMHNLMLRYWLATGGIKPDQDVVLTVVPPIQMVANLQAGKLDGYCVAEPWNQRAVAEQAGFIVATGADIWPGHPEKVLGMLESWVKQHPKTYRALLKAMLEACQYCADPRNTQEVRQTVKEYLGVDLDIIQLNTYPDLGSTPRHLRPSPQFYSHCPDPNEQLWMLTQMARWGILSWPDNWASVTQQVAPTQLFQEIAQDLGGSSNICVPEPIRIFDGIPFDPTAPLSYLKQTNIPH